MDIIPVGRGNVTYDLTEDLEDIAYENSSHPGFLAELKDLAERHNIVVSEITIDHDGYYNMTKWMNNSHPTDDQNTEPLPPSEIFADLTGFQRDILVLLASMESPKGLEIKERLEEYYSEEINHGRLYPNLNTLCEEGFAEKNSADERSNAYELTPSGVACLKGRRAWEDELFAKRIISQDGGDETSEGGTKFEESTENPTVDSTREPGAPAEDIDSDHSRSLLDIIVDDVLMEKDD